ncbi:hypothetical protein [Paractinoplanes toevensis]|uniref:Uncharacterized protein n=1 Tax=Paractinoplanes toevensis TaxID=571911 RepID=A0A919WBI7_9ACTN|nr:hypothetical protein [Actinoplanes toevensis]GIM97161.1 hypothetical protein Ato02nite_089540 [Actinoplanes toevensis]
MSRILLIELRRSAVLWVAVTLLAAGTWLLYSARERWTSGYMILALDQRWYLPLLVGIAMAAGAGQAAREHRSGVHELFAGVPRPRSQQVVPMLLVYGAAMVVAYTGATGLAALRIIDTAQYLRAGAVAGVVVAGATALVAAAWFGLAVGRILPYIITAPALAIASMASPLVARGITGQRQWLSSLLFPAYGLGGPTDFASIPGRFSIAQMLYLAGLAAGAALLFAAADRPARLMALVPPVLGIAAAALILQGGSAFVEDPIDPAARELVCTDDAPQICVARLHSGVLAEVTPPARAALATLDRLPDGPTRAQEHVDSDHKPVDQSSDTLLIPLAIGDDGHVTDLDRLEGYLVYNLGVRPFACPDDRPGPDAAVVNAASSWLLGTESQLSEAGSATENARARELWRNLRGLDEREAAARVAAVRQAVLTCASGEGLLDRPASGG